MRYKRVATAAIDDNSVNPQSQCRIFALPAEIRNTIYILVLTVRTEPAGTVKIARRSGAAQPTVLSLLQTCRLIEHEAYGIFYASSRLEVGYRAYDPQRGDYSYTFPNLVCNLSALRLAAIQELTVRIGGFEHAASVLKCLGPCVDLKRLFLICKMYGRSFWEQDINYVRHEFKREWPFLRKAMKLLPLSLRTVALGSDRQSQDQNAEEAHDEFEMETCAKLAAALKAHLERGLPDVKRSGVEVNAGLASRLALT